MKNVFRELLDAPEPACGAFITIGDPAIVEMVGIAGYDFVFIDLEHTAIGLESLENLLRAAWAHRIGTLVRVPDHDPKFILRTLDIGVEAVLIPHVRDAATAKASVDAVRYPPLGERGFYGISRAANFGAHGLANNEQLAAALNDSLVLAILIEDKEGIAASKDIVATPGVDLVLMGPADLSASMGLLGSKKHPDILRAFEQVRDACRVANVPICLPVEHGMYPLTASEAFEMGSRMFIAGTDRSLLLEGFRATRARLRDFRRTGDRSS